MSHDGRKGQSETDSEEGVEMKVLGAWIARCTLGVILSSAVLAAQAQAAVPNPAVQGPIEAAYMGMLGGGGSDDPPTARPQAKLCGPGHAAG